MAWDDYIHRYIGGTDSDADLLVGITGAITDPKFTPKVLKCPADRIEISIDYIRDFAARRTYAMNHAGMMDVLGRQPLPPPAKEPLTGTPESVADDTSPTPPPAEDASPTPPPADDAT